MTRATHAYKGKPAESVKEPEARRKLYSSIAHETDFTSALNYDNDSPGSFAFGRGEVGDSVFHGDGTNTPMLSYKPTGPYRVKLIT